MNFYIYYIEDKYKDEIFDLSSALYIKDLMDFNNKIFSSSTPVSFLDLIYKKYEYGIDQIYPNLIIKENNNQKTLYLQDIVMFNKENEIIKLDDIEGIYYNIVSNNIDKTTLNIPCDDELFTISINNTKSKYKFKNNIFYINTELTGKLTSYNCKYDLDKPNTTKELSNLTNQFIKDNIEKLIDKSKNNNIDFIGIGNYIYKHNSNYFDFKNNNWNNKLKNINIEINVNTIINSIGEMRK